MLPPQLKMASLNLGMGTTQIGESTAPANVEQPSAARPAGVGKPDRAGAPKGTTPVAAPPGAPKAFKGATTWGNIAAGAGHLASFAHLGLLGMQGYDMLKEKLRKKPEEQAVHPVAPAAPRVVTANAQFGAPPVPNPIGDKVRAIAHELTPSALVARAKGTADGAGNAALDYLEAQQRPALTGVHLQQPAHTHPSI